MKKFKEFIKEEAPAVSVGAGMQGLSSAQGAPVAGYDKLMMGGKPLRRKPPQMFGGKAVFKVPSSDYHKAVLGKKKFKHFKSYVSGEIGEEITQYAKENKNAPIIVQDEKTGAMYYLRNGSN